MTLAAKPAGSNQAARRLAVGARLQPPHNLPFYALAKSCGKCGELITTPDHRLRKDSGGRPECQPCRNARERYRYATEEERRKRINEENLQARARQNAEARQVASHHCQPFTQQELSLLADESLAHREVATQIGRTVYSVITKRHRMRKARTGVGVQP